MKETWARCNGSGATGKVCPMIGLLALCISGWGLLGVFGVWWLGRLIRQEADLLHGVAIDQSRQLAVVSTELHNARVQVARVSSEVAAVRVELEGFVHGPPSMKRPPMAAS